MGVYTFNGTTGPTVDVNGDEYNFTVLQGNTLIDLKGAPSLAARSPWLSSSRSTQASPINRLDGRVRDTFVPKAGATGCSSHRSGMRRERATCPDLFHVASVSNGKYDSPNIHAEPADDHGIRVGRKRVARLMTR